MSSFRQIYKKFRARLWHPKLLYNLSQIIKFAMVNVLLSLS